LIYPIILHLFSTFSFLGIPFLPVYALFFLVDPAMFLEEDVSQEELENWDTYQKPRPGIPAIISELYSIANLLIFDPAYLKGEGKWGLNMGVFSILFSLFILLDVLQGIFEPFFFVWLILSLLTLPILMIVEYFKGDFTLDEVPIEYAVYTEKPAS